MILYRIEVISGAFKLALDIFNFTFFMLYINITVNEFSQSY